MHFAIRFLTEYHYDAPVTDNLNALRVRPATTSSQRCDEFHTRIDPEARVSRHLDYFGTEVIEFGIPTSHEDLTIDMRARVVTSAPPEPPEASWENLASAAYVDAAGEFALPWQDKPAIPGLDELEREMGADSPLETLLRLCELIPERFEYRAGVTYVGSSVTDPGWLDQIPTGRPTLVIAEGLLMYVSEREVRQLLDRMVDRFDSGELLFDTLARLAPEVSKVMTKGIIKWGIGDARDIATWNAKLRFLEQTSVFAGYNKIDSTPVRWIYKLQSMSPFGYYDMINRFAY